jgi:hypothetical protein
LQLNIAVKYYLNKLKMLNCSNLVILFGIFSAIIAAFFKHFWILLMILSILLIYKALVYFIDQFTESKEQII